MQISVVVPSFQSNEVIGHCLSALLQQTLPPQEIIVVDSTGAAAARDIQRRFPAVRVLARPQQTYPAAARNIGVGDCISDIIAFTDADCVPASDWLAQLAAALAVDDRQAVGGSIRNAWPGNWVAQAEFFIEFREFSEHGPGRNSRFVPSCNFAIRRELFLAVGGFPDVRASEDTLLGWRLAQRGASIWFEPKARIAHRNRRHWRPFLNNQRLLGHHAARVRRRYALPGAALARWRWLFPLLPLLLFGRTLQHLLKGASWRARWRQLAAFLLVTPAFLIGAAWWSWGFFEGTRARSSDSPDY